MEITFRESMDRADGVSVSMPDSVLESINAGKGFQWGDLFLKVKFEYHCLHCHGKLRHIASTGEEALLECDCGTWKGWCSPFIGSWYGGSVTYSPYSLETRRERYEDAVARAKARWLLP